MASAATSASSSSSSGVPAHAAVRLGVVGVGTIATAVVKGLCTAPAVPPKSVLLSPRGRANVASLKAAFPDRCSVAASNQAVVDGCDWVILAVLPEQANAIVGGLKFRPEQVIINFISTLTIEQTYTLAKEIVPRVSIVKVVPLPPVARHQGATIVCPRHDGVLAMFDTISAAVPVATEKQAKTMMVGCCMMGTYYQFLDTMEEWMLANGIDKTASSPFLANLFHGISSDAVAHHSGKGFKGLVEEQTPGGLNEGAVRHLVEAGAFTHVTAAMDGVAARIFGKPADSDDKAGGGAGAGAGASATKKQRTG